MEYFIYNQIKDLGEPSHGNADLMYRHEARRPAAGSDHIGSLAREHPAVRCAVSKPILPWAPDAAISAGEIACRRCGTDNNKPHKREQTR
jgi:hypothetical protein